MNLGRYLVSQARIFILCETVIHIDIDHRKPLTWVFCKAIGIREPSDVTLKAPMQALQPPCYRDEGFGRVSARIVG
jgi:hypothetical protein